NSLDAGLQQVFACNDATAGRAATALLPAAAGLGAGADESVAWTLHQFYRRLLFGLIGSSVDVAAVAVVHQAAKGRGFSSALHSCGPLTATPRLRRDLQRTRADEALLPGPPPDVELPGGAETAMVCYAGSAEAETESDVDAVHRNRQRASDRRVSDELTTARSPWRLPLLTLDEVQALLPPETVLVSLMLGEGRRDAASSPVAALHGLAITRDSVEHRTMLLPQFAGGLIRFYRGTHHLTLSPLALRVAGLRRAITADPLHRVVTRDAQQTLAERPDTFLAGFLDRVPHWHAEGRRHLCVWADGPLHFVDAAVGVHLKAPDAPADRQPIAWSIDPKRRSHAAPRTGRVSLTAKLTIIESTIEYAPNGSGEELFVVGIGEHDSDPEWRFRAVSGAPLIGDEELTVVVKTPAGTPARADVTVAATVKHRRLGLLPYRAGCTACRTDC
ncbi:hypothetical protein, partial [Micromonospora sp. NPDC047134]|uniref:hypothetical protein n=1 Tax=Micromonospora sp. NPDC047134 TaxID=3154340 RepID=UPI0033EEEB7A